MPETVVAMTRMRLTSEKGADFWNDSCAANELQEAVDNGAVGATSNPVIVFSAVKADKSWQPVLDELIARHADATEDDIARKDLGPRGEKGVPDTATMTEDSKLQTPSPLDPGHTT